MGSLRRVPRENEEQLIVEWRWLAVLIARKYFLPGATDDDIVQEGLIGLLAAIRTHDLEQTPFRQFAGMVVERHMLSCMTAANREKHQALNEARRLAYVGEDGPVAVIDLQADPFPSAHERLETKELIRRLTAVHLTDVERRALCMCLDGDEYSDEKRLDNALQRARRKLRAAA